LQSVYDCVEVEDWLPVFTKDVETNIPCCVDVGVVYLHSCQLLGLKQKRKYLLSTTNFRRLMGIFISDSK